jgi:hypothetical protein
MSDELLSVTFRSEISLITGEVMVVMSRRMEEAKRRNVPKWWKMPVFAILVGFR